MVFNHNPDFGLVQRTLWCNDSGLHRGGVHHGESGVLIGSLNLTALSFFLQTFGSKFEFVFDVFASTINAVEIFPVIAGGH